MSNDHLTLLHDVSELAALLAGSADLEAFLRRIVEMIARHLAADVCSIYLYDEKSRILTLRATHGLNQRAVGQVRLKLGEGLTGLALQELRPVCEKCASRNPRYKKVPALGEEAYESFLAVPIHRGMDRIGVLVAQREESHPFADDDVMALRAATMQLAGAIENARLLMGWHGQQEPPADVGEQTMQVIRGKVVSEGYALGVALPLAGDSDQLTTRQASADFNSTLADFHSALQATVRQLEDLQERLKERLAEAASLIFTAHLMMLKDSRFTGEMASRIQRGEPPHVAVLAVARYYIGLFSASPHAYLREKANDVEDLARRILANLRRRPTDAAQEDRAGKVVIAAGLHPSDVLWLASEHVSGIVLVSGGLTSHVSLIACSLRIPLLIADRPDLLTLGRGTPVLLDAETGNFYVRPSPEVIARFRVREQTRVEAQAAIATLQPETRTADGTRVRLLANINLLSEVRLAMAMKAEGIGLYRTEFPFLIRTAFPAEEEQLPVYAALLRQAEGKGVTIRTLDLGGDKLLLRSEGREENPALGLRSTRFLLRYRDILGQQLRAILRAAAGYEKLRIIFPMISSLEEFLEARAEMQRASEQLRRSHLPCCENPQVGLMVEMPAAVEIIDDLAREADFLSIGTNDLIQYILAVDRANDRVASYFLPHHPAVLRTLRRVVDAAREREKDVVVCGEMAHDPRLIPFLLGIGIRSLSMDPRHLPAAQAAIMAISISEAERLAEAMLAECTIQGVDRIMSEGRT